KAGDRLAQVTRSLLVLVCNVSFSDLRWSRLWVRSEPSQGSHLQETLRLGWVRRFPRASPLGHDFDQRMDEALGEKLEAPPPSDLSCRFAGDCPFRLAREIRHSRALGLRRNRRRTVGYTI